MSNAARPEQVVSRLPGTDRLDNSKETTVDSPGSPELLMDSDFPIAAYLLWSLELFDSMHTGPGYSIKEQACNDQSLLTIGVVNVQRQQGGGVTTKTLLFLSSVHSHYRCCGQCYCRQ